MALLWTDGTWTSESQVGGYRLSYPIDGVTSAIVCEADYIVQRSSYTVPTLGSSATINSLTFYHVADGPQIDLGGGMVRFTRRWATKPTGHDEYESHAYHYIGFYGAWGINATTVTGRDRFTKKVTSRLAHAYYLIKATGGDYTTPANIPLIAAQRYILTGTENDLDYLADAPPFSTASSPTRTAYEALISGGSEIVAEESVVSRYMGPLYVRVTRYVPAL